MLDDVDGDGEYEGDDDDAPEDRGPAADGDASDDWDQRQLCPDDACIGLIGPDGKCKVCKRSAA